MSWRRDGQPIESSDKVELAFEQSSGSVSLTIREIGPGDEGVYSCTARQVIY